jgi:predicted transglutaminase-like cysteine proteinase
MASHICRLVGAMTLVLALYIPFHGETEAAGANVGYIAVGRETLVPYGWVEFCQRYAGECDSKALPALDVKYSPETMKAARRINHWVNTHIKPMSDKDHWGVIDRWDYPTDGYGDCEDYALLKRRLLIEEGFPRQGLLMTVVKDEQGEGHAILTLKTDNGEYILDNLDNEVRPWSRTHYKFVKRQSQTDEEVWVDIGEPTSAPLIVSR